MGMYAIKNESVAILINTLGAELRSLKDCHTGQEYLWNADPAYWKRTSPILFPLVGNYKNKEMRYDGRVYPMSQHGFARDMEFEYVKGTQESAWFRLNSNEETLRKYPFPFTLEIGYEFCGERTLRVIWKVKNTGKKKMYFSIGGHPAFLCPLHKEEKQTDYSIAFDEKEKVVSRMIGEDGLATDTLITYPLKDGVLEITEDLFDNDALVIENRQAQEVSFLTPDKKSYLTVHFDAPLFGIWSPPKKQAPFICVEPWYGRCDHADFNGTLEEREWGNCLDPEEEFQAAYTITI